MCENCKKVHVMVSYKCQTPCFNAKNTSLQSISMKIQCTFKQSILKKLNCKTSSQILRKLFKIRNTSNNTKKFKMSTFLVMFFASGHF